MCIWQSKDKRFICDRIPLENSDYCLFHKPNKTNDEAKLFWRIINFRNFSQKLFELSNQQYNTNGINQVISQQCSIELNNVQNSNFSHEEIGSADFSIFRQKIIDLYYESRISGRGNMSYPDFNGFIFPNAEVFEFTFMYTYNPFADGSLIFKECIFNGFMNFSNFNFIGKTHFEDCEFKGTVIFTNSIFHNNVKFLNSNFINCHKYDGFGMFQNIKFLGRQVSFENIKGLPLEFDCEFSEKTNFQLSNMHYPKEFGIASYGENAYKLARIQNNRAGDFDRSSYYHYLEKCYKGYQILPEPYFWNSSNKGFKKIIFLEYVSDEIVYKNIPKKIIDLIYRTTIGYGEKPFNAIITIVIIALLFSFVYMFVGGLNVDGIIIDYDIAINRNLLTTIYWNNLLNDFGNCLYFSIVTLTTVGYGDLKPVTLMAKFFAGIEMFLGVTFIGAWTATLLRKVIK